jgi:hypothetical protein
VVAMRAKLGYCTMERKTPKTCSMKMSYPFDLSPSLVAGQKKQAGMVVMAASANLSGRVGKLVVGWAWLCGS